VADTAAAAGAVEAGAVGAVGKPIQLLEKSAVAGIGC
jgi:hypothetical protein